MARPVLLAVDDEPEVLRAIERDLRRRYAAEYRVLRADSGDSAIDTLNQLKLRKDPVALLISDQRMPGMQGTEFLTKAKELYPDARRALLTAYADTNAAIDAINSAHTDFYFLKPWSPPEQNLYPIVDELLDDWKAGYKPSFQGIRLLGTRWSAEAHDLRDFMGRNRIPFQWIDIEARRNDKDVREYMEALGEGLCFPALFFEDGSHVCQPAISDIANKVGLRTTSAKKFYDLIIVGGGPAGLAAAVYGASEGLDTIMIEREAPGGQAGMSSRIENYLGFPGGIGGDELARRARDQAVKFHAEMLYPQDVRCLLADGAARSITLADSSSIEGKAVLIATGLAWRKLDAPGIERLSGAGIYYGAAMTEAESCADQEIYIVGGANSAGQCAVYFSRYSKQVTLVVRADSLAKSMSQYLIDQIRKLPNVRVWTQSEVAEAHGDAHLEELSIVNRATGETTRVPAAALFIFIGARPETEWLNNTLPLDERGYILTGPALTAGAGRPKGWNLDRDPFLLETGIPGVFAAGDVRHGSVKRVASGVGEGSVVVQMVHEYLAKA